VFYGMLLYAMLFSWFFIMNLRAPASFITSTSAIQATPAGYLVQRPGRSLMR